MKNRRPFLAGMFVFLVFSPLVASLSHAFRAEEPQPSSQSNRMGIQKAPLSPTPSIKPSLAQTDAAEKLSQAGITVQWDSQFNSPTTLEGDALEEKPGTGQARMAAVATGNYAQRSIAIIQNYAGLYGIQDPATELQPAGPEEADTLGFRHQRLAQVYRGVPVVGADLKVHFNAEGKAYQVTGRLIPGLNLDTTPALTPDQALNTAAKDFGSRGFGDAGVDQEPRLVIFALDPPPRLAYELVISDVPNRSYKYWIDAKTGSVIKALNMVCSLQTEAQMDTSITSSLLAGTSATLTGNVLTREGGNNVSLNGLLNGNYYYMQDSGNYTTVTYYSPLYNALYYSSRDSSAWGSSDRAEVSASVNMASTFSYFREVHNRNGVNNASLQVIAVVHWQKYRWYNYVNASWNHRLPIERKAEA